MKKNIYNSILLILLLFFVSIDSLQNIGEKCEYVEPRTFYSAKYESEYWNLLDDDYSKMYYEATLKTDFSDSTRKSIYQFDSNNIDYTLKLKMMKAIQFARLDHPERELMDFYTKTNMKFLINKKGIVCKFYSSYICKNFKEYSTLLDEVNLEIQDLVTTVNNTNDIVEKYKLIFQWITSNVEYERTNKDVKTIGFLGDEYVLSELKTNSTQNIYGAIVNKKAICDGIADAYKYICNCCNLECLIVDGYVGNISDQNYHAWNLIKVEDEWYLVDATWNLGKDSLDYFMVKDIKKGNRTPINIGYDLPGYSSLEQSSTEGAVTPSDIIIE